MHAVILDTNILVAAGFNKRSSSAKIVNAIEQGKLKLVWNQATFKETQMIVCKIPPLNWSNFSKLYQKSNEYIGRTSPNKFSMISDPDDRKFAALAQATDATLISNDDHLLSERQDLEIKIQTPTEFLSTHSK